MDRKEALILRDYLNETLNIPGHVVVVGSARYTQHDVTIKVTITPYKEDGTIPESKEARDFRDNAVKYGLKPGDLGATFTRNGRTHRITGAVPRRPKMPILTIELETGRQFKWPALTVRNSLNHIEEMV